MGNLEGAQPGQVTWASPEAIPYRMTPCWVYKLGEEGRWGHLALWRLSSQVTVMCDGARLSWGWLSTCLPMGSGEWIPCFALLACPAFALPLFLTFPFCYYYCYYCCSYLFILFKLLNCSYLNPWLLHCFLILLPIPLNEGEWATSCVVLGCRWS